MPEEKKRMENAVFNAKRLDAVSVLPWHIRRDYRDHNIYSDDNAVYEMKRAIPAPTGMTQKEKCLCSYCSTDRRKKEDETV